MSKSKVVEISDMKYRDDSIPIVPSDAIVDVDAMSIENAIEVFKKVFNKNIDEWGEFEEEKFIAEIRKVTELMNDLQMIDKVVDTVIALSYKRQIENFKDYLFVLCAKNTFPERMTKYETLQPVIEDMFNEASYQIDKMDYKAENIQDLAISLFILNKYFEQLPIGMEEAADKIFSSIGIRYSTVEHIWREYNG